VNLEPKFKTAISMDDSQKLHVVLFYLMKEQLYNSLLLANNDGLADK
jgi:hypothetical protein